MDVDLTEDIGAPAERTNAQAGPSSRQITNEGSSTSEAPLLLSDAHEMRITRGGQIRHFVQFALKFLDEQPERPLILHTLPASSSAKSSKTPNSEGRGKPPETTEHGEADSSEASEPDDDTNDPKLRTRPASSIVSATIPRLISIVEIIKREYLKSRPKARVKVGLWQYNEMTWIQGQEEIATETDEQGDGEEREKKRARMIIETLEGGKKHLPIRRTPCLKVTLCARELDPKCVSSQMTLQPPATQKMSKAARARETRKRRKENALKNATEVKEQVQKDGKSSATDIAMSSKPDGGAGA